MKQDIIEIKKQELEKIAPWKEAAYRNGIIAGIYAMGKEEVITPDWLKNTLLGDVEDGFMTQGQALTLYGVYCEYFGFNK